MVEFIFILIFGLFLAVCLYVWKKKIHIWLLSYLKNLLSPAPAVVAGPKHVMFLFVDHYELAGKKERLDAWMQNYPVLAKKHRDSDGVHPKHTWYYALDLMHENELEALQGLVKEDLGELELHWHHGNDDEHSFTQKLREAMVTFHKYGYMRPNKEGELACFSFIHGDWSLANSRGDRFCGVDNEIEVLMREGCYGDFTFPALFREAQPRSINSIYYCNDQVGAKSYDVGRASKVGSPQANNEFLIFQGPLTINWKDWRFKWHPRIEDGDINYTNTQSDPKRIDAWIRQGIHVEGRPEWVFVKVFCHGAQDHKAVLGEHTDKMFSYLEQNYNDGERYCLHYVTAREAYNIVKAAEDGKSGNPNDFRDYIIAHPLKR